jgi:hypothetical protein
MTDDSNDNRVNDDVLRTAPKQNAKGQFIGTTIYLPSNINETFDWNAILPDLKGIIFVNASRVKDINSYGVKKYIKEIPFAGRTVYLYAASPGFMEGLGFLPVSLANQNFVSVYVEYECLNGHGYWELFEMNIYSSYEFLAERKQFRCKCGKPLKLDPGNAELVTLDLYARLRNPELDGGKVLVGLGIASQKA